MELPSSFQIELSQAVNCLVKGGVVVFPTDTLYGLGADISNGPALTRIYNIKGRPQQMALPVLVSDWNQVLSITNGMSDAGYHLAELYWPGPLTLVAHKSPNLSRLVTGGLDTVAVRQPDHWVPLHLAAELGPITGTSANLTGQPDLLNIDAIQGQLGSMVDLFIKCGPTPKGTSSTVVDITTEIPLLIREGALPFTEVLAVCGL